MKQDLIPWLLSMLTIKYNERFRLCSIDSEVCENGLFYFDREQGLVHVFPNQNHENACNKLYDILTGYYKVIRLPWRPHNGEKYWSIHFYNDGQNVSIRSYTWTGDTSDCARCIAGLCYQSQEVAEAFKFSDFEKLTDKKWEDIFND